MPPKEGVRIDSSQPLVPQLAKIPEEQLHQMMVQASQWADYQKYTGLMDDIAHQMKEIPVLPSEDLKRADTNALKKVEFPKEGGVLTWMEGFDHPFKGYPHFEFVDKIDFIKKVNRAFLSGLYHQLKRYRRWRFVTLLPAMWITKDVLRAWVYIFYRNIDRFKIKNDKYCQAVTEIYRAFSRPIENEKRVDAEFREHLRDLVCMILEFDNAYRFRAQDILPEVDKEKLRKHPRREIVRLLDLMASREATQEIKDTWKLLKYVVNLYLIFDTGLQKIVTNMMYNLDLSRVKLDDGDKEFCAPRADYTFGFLLNPDEHDQKLIELHQLEKNWKKESQDIRDASTAEHEALKDPKPGEIEALNKKHETILNAAFDRYKVEKDRIKSYITKI